MMAARKGRHGGPGGTVQKVDGHPFFSPTCTQVRAGVYFKT